MLLAARREGFTLIELLVTIAVSGILLAMALPSFSDMVEKKRLKRAAETVAGDFHRFKQAGQKYRVNPDPATPANGGFHLGVNVGSACYGIKAGGASDCSVAPSYCSDGNAIPCDVLNVGSDKFKGISSITTSTTDYSYDWRRGTVTAGNVTLLTAGGFDLRVRVSGLGRTSVCSPSDNVTGYPSC